MKFHPLLVAFLATTAAASCANFTWTGTVDANWNTAANWTGGAPASANTTALVFDSGAQVVTVNNINGGLVLNSLSISSASPARTFNGNLLRFAGTSPQINLATTGGHTVISAPLQLDANLRTNSPANFVSHLRIPGNVSGTGGIIAHQGVTELTGTNIFTGATVVRNGGLLGVAGGGVAGSSGISVETGGEFQLLKNTFVSRPMTLSGGLTSSARQNVIFGGTSPSCEYSGAISVVGDSEIRAFSGSDSSLEAMVVFPVSGAVNLAGGDLIASTEGPGNTLKFSSVITGTGDVTAEAADG
ncbi:MAG: hypothetical protein EOP85_03430, partial [Verrucomicrobiaceae bacterium]